MNSFLKYQIPLKESPKMTNQFTSMISAYKVEMEVAGNSVFFSSDGSVFSLYYVLTQTHK